MAEKVDAVVGSGEGSRPASVSGQSTPEPGQGEWMDVSPFGALRTWDEGRDIGLMWEEPRDIAKVVVGFAPGAEMLEPCWLRLQYWRSGGWPKERVPRDDVSDVSGWLETGDWFQGEWRDADVVLDARDNTWTYTFAPLNAKEFPNLADYPAPYRTTMKIRLLCEQSLPETSYLNAFTDSAWEITSFAFDWGSGPPSDPDSASLEVFNGHVEGCPELAGGRSIDVWYAKPAAVLSADKTVVTLRYGDRSFSFAPADIAAGKRVFVRDLGVLVKPASDAVTYAEMESAHGKQGKCRYDLVAEMPEQTLSKTWSAMPERGRIYMPLGCEGARQRFAIMPNGNVGVVRRELTSDSVRRGPDTGRAKWNGITMAVGFGLPQGTQPEKVRRPEPPSSMQPGRDIRTGASLVDGILPIALTWFEHDGVRYTEEAFATPLSGELPVGGVVESSETLVLMLRLRLTNLSNERKKAVLPITVADEGGPQQLFERNGLIYCTQEDEERLRLRIDAKGVAEIGGRGEKIECSVDLPPRAIRDLYAVVPMLALDTAEELGQLGRLDYDEQREMITSYWRARLRTGSHITTPEPMIDDFVEALPTHLFINTNREPGGGPGSERHRMPRVGSFAYGVYGNEAVMMTTDMDRRGYHDVARECYDMWLDYQGTAELPGDYASKEGVLYGCGGGYEAGGYNQHHGWILWGLAEHYWFTRDDAWMKRAAPKFIAACDWITRERRRSLTDEYTGIRRIDRGLMPAGRLEDIKAWKSWLAHNGASCWGMTNAAKVLAAIKHPEAARVAKDAEEFRAAIRAAFLEAMVRTPVVPLRDGTCIPIVPSDAHARGRAAGWIMETLEGSINLIRYGIFDSHERVAEWILKDYEDNRYLNPPWGYEVKDQGRDWFNLGGFSIQAAMLCSPTPFLTRDEPKHYVRSALNIFASGYFPERAMMTEVVPQVQKASPWHGNFAGDHFKSSDEALMSGWIRWMFIWDEGEDLCLGMAIPRYWLADGQEIGLENAATHFGPMSVRLRSHATEGRIEMTIDPPTRNKPRAIYARFRHPDGKTMNRASVDGKAWKDIDPEKEWVVLPALAKRTVVTAYYD